MTPLLRIAAVLWAAAAQAHDGPHPVVTGPADGWVYPLAAPGTYALPPIRAAADAALLDETGARRSLSALLDGRVTVMAFVYTRCADLCPLASYRMADLQDLAAADPALAGAMRLLTVSFDPARDSPAVMADYGAAFRGDAGPEWLFLTPADAAAAAAMTAAWDQPVLRGTGADGASDVFSHVLRVFLVDAQGRVRNIYSADFLDPRLVANDARTLLIEAAGR